VSPEVVKARDETLKAMKEPSRVGRMRSIKSASVPV
jgi:hypothetical protein